MRTELASWRIILELDPYFGAPASGRWDEVDRARRVDLGFSDRAPTNQLVLSLGDDLGVPFDAQIKRPFGRPVRAVLTGRLNRLQVPHDPRQIREVTPVAVQLLAGTKDRHGLIDPDTVLGPHTVLWAGRSGGVQTKGLIGAAVARHSTVNERSSQKGKPQPAQGSPRKPVERNRGAADERGHALAFTDIDGNGGRVTLFRQLNVGGWRGCRP